MAYSIQTWKKLKAEYESGKYESLDDLVSKMRLKGMKCPALSVVKRYCFEQGWDKKALEPEIERSEREKMIEYAAQKGFKAHKAALDTVIEMLLADRVAITRDPGAKEGEAQAFAEVMPDWQARDKAVNHLTKLFALSAPTEKDPDESLRRIEVCLSVVDQRAINQPKVEVKVVKE